MDIHIVGHRKTAVGLLVDLIWIVLKTQVFRSRGCGEGTLARLERMQGERIKILAECVLASIFQMSLDHFPCRAERLEQIEAKALVRYGQA